jgi:hypothetical protein
MNTFQWAPHSRKARLFCAAFLITILSLISESTYASERKTYTTFGQRDCKAWTQDRQKSLTGSQIDQFSAFGDTSWFLGYLSALNGAMAEIDVLAAIDAKTAFLWVDRYCAQNPNKDIADAAHGLFFELTKIEVKKLEDRKNRSKK